MSTDPRRAALRAGLEALSLPADDVLLDRLLAYLDLLQKWNQAYNLTAVRDPQQMVRQHLLDCLAALAAAATAICRAVTARILDVGSGAGLPGVVWALMRPNWAVCCVDTVAKKASFVRQVAAELALRNLHSEHARVEAAALAAVRRDGLARFRFAGRLHRADPPAPVAGRLLAGHEGQGARRRDRRVAADVSCVSRGTIAGARPGRPALPGLDAAQLTQLSHHRPDDPLQKLG